MDVEWTLDGYLQRVNIDRLARAIDGYKRASRKYQTRPQIRRALFDVLRAPGVANIVLPFRYIRVPVGAKLYRARKIIEPGQIKSQEDVWMAPPSYIGAGRLNDVGEPLLYASANGATALYEVRAEPGDLVAVTRFRVATPFLSMALSARLEEPELSFLSQRKLRLITRFIEEVFTQDIPADESHRYIAPDLLAKEFLNMPSKLDGWTYRSVADPRGENLWAVNTCIRGECAKSLLEYEGTDIIEVSSLDMYKGHTRLSSLGPIRGTMLLRPAICTASLPSLIIPKSASVTSSMASGPGLAEVADLVDKRKSSAEAEVLYQQSLNYAPAAPLAELGLRFKEQGRLDVAEELFRKSATRGSNLGATYLGILLAERGDVKEAETFFRSAASHRFPYGLRCLGVLLARLGRVSEAESAYRDAAGQGDVESMSNLGASLYSRGALRQAEPFLRKAVATGSAHAMYGLARLVYDRGHKEEAERLLKEAADLKEPQAMAWLGMSLVEENKTEEGLSLIRSAAASGDAQAIDYLENFTPSDWPDFQRGAWKAGSQSLDEDKFA
ncbi:tetratricopeptide repeat protein [Pseudarthrobacter oxydans]|uniref:tetratricopeptide repeat protein n=1 Tax=Pseudarthrobacter oxydans TaxID=1671 RepID=UPI00380AD0A2